MDQLTRKCCYHVLQNGYEYPNLPISSCFFLFLPKSFFIFWMNLSFEDGFEAGVNTGMGFGLPNNARINWKRLKIVIQAFCETLKADSTPIADDHGICALRKQWHEFFARLFIRIDPSVDIRTGAEFMYMRNRCNPRFSLCIWKTSNFQPRFHNRLQWHLPISISFGLNSFSELNSKKKFSS